MNLAFLIAGFGYGNATRELAVIKEVRQSAPDISITVFSWGRGYDFLLNESKEVGFELKSLASGDRRIGSSYQLSFLFSTLTYLLSYPFNIISLALWARKQSPDIVIFDSDYHMPAFLFSKARRISVNQAANIYLRGQQYPWNFILKSGFFLSHIIESWDFRFQYLFSHEILVPSIAASDFANDPKLRAVSLIVRKEFLFAEGSASGGHSKPAVVLGGSGIQVSDMKLWAERSQTKIFERKSQSDATQENLSKELIEFNPIIVQGGLSSLSECLALGKFMLIIPVQNHWEQFINGQEIESLGLGKVTSIEKIDSSLQEFLNRKSSGSNKKVSCTGAKEISDIILGKIQK